MRKGVIDFSEFGKHENGTVLMSENDLGHTIMLGQIAILTGCGVWMLLATAFKLPVSTTHSIVGATIGFALVAQGSRVIVWEKIYRIFFSWIISPLLSGIVSVFIYLSLDHLVLRREQPLHSGIRVLPALYFICFAFNVFAIVYKGPSFLYFDRLSLTQCLIISGVFGLAVALIFAFFLAPYLKDHILSKELLEITGKQRHSHHGHNEKSSSKRKEFEMEEGNGKYLESDNNGQPLLDQPTIVVSTCPSNGESTSSFAKNTIRPSSSLASFFRSCKPEDPQASRLFSLLQVMTACFGGFAHGGNDVSNAIAPLVSLYLIANDGMKSADMETPWYLLLYGSFGMCLGLWVLGHRVIYTVGENLTKITPASGFAVEFGAAVTVLIASKLGLPISSTQCKVGSVVAVGLVQSRHQVHWGVFRNISLSWIVTLPVAGLLSGGTMMILHLFSFGTDATPKDSILQLFF
ncbi:Phosphate transporter [Caenorhabditis elegans]|nr:Phosphate transporter [Caenorhabditis elegans]CDM63562.1 Phosphate transporter [Caenorhabditis elegans]|eukprot:NP_001294196.1 Phosphate transporter [Caenorhabditis elegans]